MILPEINLTFLESIIPVTFHIHSLFVHFVIAIPVLLLILEIVNIVAKKSIINYVNIGLIGLVFISLLAAYITGAFDAQNISSSKDIANATTEHKTIGVYILLFGMSFIIIFKVIALFAQKTLYSLLYILMILLFIFVTMIEAKSGSELVDKYGVNVTKVVELQKIQSDLNITNINQLKKIVEMNQTIIALQAKELNNTNRINTLLELNRTREHNASIKKESNATISETLKSLF